MSSLACLSERSFEEIVFEVVGLETSTAKDANIVDVRDKSGQQTKKFYARSGNSSEENPLEEMSACIKKRSYL